MSVDFVIVVDDDDIPAVDVVVVAAARVFVVGFTTIVTIPRPLDKS